MATSADVRWQRALITGASQGLGKHFARTLARRGVDLVLVARSVDILEALAQDLRTMTGVAVEVLVADLTDERDAQRVAARVQAGVDPVDLLINNAGAGTIGAFDELPAGREQDIVKLNVGAPLRLTRAAVESMQRRGSGTILNVASIAGYAPIPYFAVYSATKAFLLAMTLAVREELRGSGVSVTALCPGFIDTGFVDRAGVEDPPLRFLWADPQRVVDKALRGARRGRAVVLPGASVRLAAIASRVAPPAAFTRIAGAATRRFGRDIIETAQAEVAGDRQGPPPAQDELRRDRA